MREVLEKRTNICRDKLEVGSPLKGPHALCGGGDDVFGGLYGDPFGAVEPFADCFGPRGETVGNPAVGPREGKGNEAFGR